MEIQKDFREFLELLNSNQVDYMIIGAYALSFYGRPRSTGDLDIWIKNDERNSKKLLKALDEFGFGGLDISEEDLLIEDNVIQLGFPPIRIDILTSISGVLWGDAVNSCVVADYGSVSVKVIGKKELIQNKKSTGRLKDLADIEFLDED